MAELRQASNPPHGMAPALAAVLAALWVWASAVESPAARPAAEGLPPRLLESASPIDDPLELLAPARPTTEEEQDRLDAAAHYAQGRLLFQREKFADALRHYQRAARYDPAQISLLREIVPLAFELERPAVAARYAVLAAEHGPSDAVLLRRLALHLAQQEDFQRAARLYEKAIGLNKNAQLDASVAILHLELGRVRLLGEEPAAAAKALDLVRDAFEHPDKYGLSERLKEVALGKPEDTLALLAETYFQAGRYDDARAMHDRLHQHKPNDLLYALAVAQIEAKQERHAAALERLTGFLAGPQQVDSFEPYELLFDLLKKKHPTEAAARSALLDQLAPAYEREPEAASLAVFYGRQLTAAGRHDTAAQVLRKAVAAQPSVEGWQALVELEVERNDIDRLLDTIAEAVELLGGLEPLGDAGEALHADRARAEQLIAAADKRLAAAGEQNADIVARAAAWIALHAEMPAAAERFFWRAYEAPEAPRAELASSFGLELLVANQYDAAVRVFERAIADKIRPDSEAAFQFYLAGALELAGRTDDALAAAQRAVELRKSPLMQSRIAWIHYHAKQHEAAERAYRQLLAQYDADHSNDDLRDVLRTARLILSNLCVEQQRTAEAIEWLEQVLDEFPEDIGAMNDLGYLWADENQRLRRALAMVERAVAAEPDNRAYRDSLGWALYRLGRYQEAVRHLEQAIDGDDDPDGVLLDHLADAYQAAGQGAQARETWRRAQAAFERQSDERRAKLVAEKLQAASE